MNKNSILMLFFVCNIQKNLYNIFKFIHNFWLVAKKKIKKSSKKSYSSPVKNLILSGIFVLLAAV